MPTADIIIIGGGIIGAAIAREMAIRGAGRIIVIEREAQPGSHATSQNAGIARQFEEDPNLHQLAVNGVAKLCEYAHQWELPNLFTATGSLLLNPPTDRPPPPSILINHQEALRHHPLLNETPFEHALWTASDGVIDVHALLWGLIHESKKAGVDWRCDEMVIGVNKSGDQLTGVITDRETYSSPCIINAAGAWAGVVGVIAGASPISFHPMRRHLFASSPDASINPQWPVVWDLENHYYFRPESGGWLLSACDETEIAPGYPKTDDSVILQLAGKMATFSPPLRSITIANTWAGLRTFTDDRSPAIGWDPRLNGFFWAAGLGGRGITTAGSVATLTADAILNQSTTPFAPERLG